MSNEFIFKRLFMGEESMSNSVSPKQNHNVLMKVNEHRTRNTKEAKKLGLNKKPKVELDFDWFKKQELKALEARRAKALEEIEHKKAARK